MPREFYFAFSCEQTIALLSATLAPHGIRLERSFDLRSALRDQSACLCPQHGTAPCTCQYVVLLVYEEAAGMSPTTLTIHECAGLTRVRVNGEPGGGPSSTLLAALAEAFIHVT